jgi:hypothetical protein
MKIHDTRKEKAATLLDRVTKGPSFSLGFPQSPHVACTAEAQEAYRRWADTWILPLVKELVPELK